jgi:hypothetical protein
VFAARSFTIGPRFAVATLIAFALALSACGSDAASPDKSAVAEKGVVDKSTSSASKASSSSTGTRKLDGPVCRLLTTAEVENVAKTGRELTALEADPGPGTERSCSYMMANVAPMVVISLQGEVDPVDWPATKGLPGAKSVSVRGAEAAFWPTTNVLYVHKNGLAVAVQVVVPPAGETVESASGKLAQPIADRLP